jgi:hypothetical protein
MEWALVDVAGSLKRSEGISGDCMYELVINRFDPSEIPLMVQLVRPIL